MKERDKTRAISMRFNLIKAGCRVIAESSISKDDPRTLPFSCGRQHANSGRVGKHANARSQRRADCRASLCRGCSKVSRKNTPLPEKEKNAALFERKGSRGDLIGDCIVCVCWKLDLEFGNL